MVVYSCQCLNIQIFAESGSPFPAGDALSKCPFGSKANLVQLIDQGFQFRHKCLVHRSRSGPWTVYMCVLCQTQTHAVDHEAKTVAVSPKMEKGAVAISHLKSHEDFSSIFQLLLNQSDNDQKSQDVQPQSYETLQKQIAELQSVLADQLKTEEEAMEMRIKKYEEEQRSAFAKLTEKGQKEKAKLVSLLFKQSESSKNHLTPAEKVTGQSHVALSHSKSSDPYQEKRNSRHSSSSMSDYRRSRDSRDLSPDDVFAMDELEQDLDVENDNSPQTRSGQSPSTLNNRLRHEQDRNNSNHPHQQSRSRSRGKDIPGGDNSHDNQHNRIQMSTSVPISMPMASRNLRNSSNVDSDIDEELAEFNDIPRCMQALSESIQERDRYIFGDRPRQRVNTGDFTQLNWR